ncbi:MAG TPA: hypothetical protein VFI27_08850 [candidate division Zixibacteria bacterium]|nr:hypothetical protein [candidate division Zixibacteria bacterium]
MSRKRIRQFLAIAALIMLVVAFWPSATSLYDLTGEESLPGQVRGLIHWLYSSVRPQPDHAPAHDIDLAGVSPYGMNTFLEQEVLPEVREEILSKLHEAGFGFIRQQFPWEDIEIHGKGDFVDKRNDPEGIGSWEKYDNIVDLAEQYDIEIIARLDNPPAWSRALTNTIGTHAPPDDFDDYADFVEAVVSRYQGRIQYYQLWNEPNIYPEWGEQPVDPEAFTQLLCSGYQRAKEVDPDSVILAGALSPTIALDSRDLNDLVFMQRMYDAGVVDCFDILSAQGYGLWSGPTDQRLRPTVINYAHAVLLRDLMVANDDAQKAIWISEAGWNTVPESMDDPYGRVSDEEQARYAVQAYERAQSEWPWAGVVNYWFFKRPSDAEKDQPWYYFRLLEPDFEPSLAWSSLSEYTSAGEPTSVNSGLSFTHQRIRPVLALAGGAILFFIILGYLSPKRDS